MRGNFYACLGLLQEGAVAAIGLINVGLGADLIGGVHAQQSQQDILLDNAGSIAEASLRLNGVFEAAQRACDQYTANIEKLNSRQQRICARMEKETRENCRKMVAETRKECDRMLEEAQIQAVACRNGTDKSQALSDSRAVLQALIDNKDFYRNE